MYISRVDLILIKQNNEKNNDSNIIDHKEYNLKHEKDEYNLRIEIDEGIFFSHFLFFIVKYLL